MMANPFFLHDFYFVTLLTGETAPEHRGGKFQCRADPNLNLVGFDTIITLHPPHHPTTGTLILPERMVLEV